MTQVPATQTDKVPAQPTPTEMFVASIMNRVIASGCYVGGFGIMGQALTAETLDEAMNIGEVVNVQDHLRERIRFNKVSFADSDPSLDSRIPVFAVIDVVLDDGTGQVQKMATGAEHVVGTLLRAVEKGWLPFEGQLIPVDLGGKKEAINLVPVPARVANTAKK